MTYGTAREALAAARKIFKDHGLKGVKLDIWHNMGWHIALRHRHFGIWPSYGLKGVRFWAMAAHGGYGSGDIRWTSDRGRSFKTPALALASVAKEVRRAMARDAELLAAIEGALAGKSGKARKARRRDRSSETLAMLKELVRVHSFPQKANVASRTTEAAAKLVAELENMA